MVSAVLDLVSTPAVLYGAILVLLTVDAFVPVVPAQALMIGGGILSTTGHVELVLLVASGALGAVSGDLLAFFVGRRLARRDAAAPERLTRRKPRAITLRLTEAMRKHIFLAVLFGRFIPAGRMITAMYAGRNGVSTRRFATYDIMAGTLWASYGALLGHFGGQAIAESSWLPLAVVGAAAVVFMAGAPLFGLAVKLRRRAVAARAVAAVPVAPVVLAFDGVAAPAGDLVTAAAPAFSLAALSETSSPSLASALTEVASPALAPALSVAALSEVPSPVLSEVASPATAGDAVGPVPPGLFASVGVGVPAALIAAAGSASAASSSAWALFAPPLARTASSARRRCRRSAVETLAAVEPMAAIEVLAAAEAVAAAESVVVGVNGLQTAS